MNAQRPMHATIRNISAGRIVFPEFSLNQGEATTLTYVTALKTYEAQKYIKIEKLTPKIPQD